MWMIVSSCSDVSAEWAYQELNREGLAPLEWMQVEAFVNISRWDHRIGAAGVSTNVSLPGGRAVSHSEIKGVLNRMSGPPSNQVELAVAADREYSQSELTAFYLSWLHALDCPVMNRPTPQGLCGRWAHQSEWITMAVEAGLPVIPYRQTANDSPLAGYSSLVSQNDGKVSVIVIGSRVFGYQIPGNLQLGCTRLAEIAKLEVMGIDFVPCDSGLAFAGATPMPALEIIGAPGIQHLAHLLKGDTA